MIALNDEIYQMLDKIAEWQSEEWRTPRKNLTYSLEIMIKTSFKNYEKKNGSNSKIEKQKDHDTVTITKQAIKEQEEDDWVTKQEKEYRKRLLEEGPIVEEHEDDWTSIEEEIKNWKKEKFGKQVDNKKGHFQTYKSIFLKDKYN